MLQLSLYRTIMTYWWVYLCVEWRHALGSRCRWLVSFTLQPRYHRFSFQMITDGPKTNMRWNSEKSLSLWKSNPGHSGRSLSYTVSRKIWEIQFNKRLKNGSWQPAFVFTNTKYSWMYSTPAPSKFMGTLPSLIPRGGFLIDAHKLPSKSISSGEKKTLFGGTLWQ